MQDFWTVYILRCADDTLYTGICTDLEARIQRHTDGRGARYTRGRGPFEIVYSQTCPSKSAALKREAEIKSMSRKAKMALVNGK